MTIAAAKANPDPVRSLEQLERQHAAWCKELDKDFRAASLNRLIAGLHDGGPVLDVGCGTGGLSALLLSLGLEVTSQDPSRAMLSMCRDHFARRRLPTLRVRPGIAEEIPEVAYFKTVVALDVIEHIEDELVALRAIRGSMRSDGRLVISVPAVEGLYGPKDLAVGHYRRYEPVSLHSVLEESGFALESMRYWNFIGVPPTLIAVKLLRRPVSERFRQTGRRRGHALLNSLLRNWLDKVERRASFGIGLTLIATARIQPT